MPVVAALSLALAFAGLGRWQLQRAAESGALTARFAAAESAGFIEPPVADPATVRFRRIRLNGRFRNDGHVLLDNMTHDGRAGYQVLSVFEPDVGGPGILINRGFVPIEGDRSRLPDAAVSEQVTTITGRIDRLPRAALDLGPGAPSPGPLYVLSYPTVDEIEAVLGRELAPYQVLLDASAGPGFRRDWPAPDDRAPRNVAYAVQWFALALAAGAAAVGMLVSARRRAREAAS